MDSDGFAAQGSISSHPRLVMNSATGTATIPGGRIDHYRNSSPRLIRLLGLGDEGGKAARSLAKRCLPNVEVITNTRPVGWKEVAQDKADANMIVILCAEGDEGLFRPEQGKPDMLVTFVLLTVNRLAASDQRLANARGFADLFVTTSDVDYVSELIDNLAS
jgi:hypothetical protein